MAGPTYIAEASATMSGSGTLSVSKPTGTATGDLMLAFIMGGTTAQGASTGWNTTVPSFTFSGSSAHGSLLSRVAQAGDGASFSFTTLPSFCSISIVTIRGGLLGSSSTATGSSSTASTPSITTTAANSLVLAFFGFSAGGTTCTPPTTPFTTALNIGSVAFTSEGQAVSYAPYATSGTVVGAQSGGLSGSSQWNTIATEILTPPPLSGGSGQTQVWAW